MNTQILKTIAVISAFIFASAITAQETPNVNLIKDGTAFSQSLVTDIDSITFSAASASPVVENTGSPVGSIMPFAGDASKVPAGWLLCDGREVSRTEYARLFDVIGTAWGAGNASTTFNLPDMRGVFLRGVSGDSNDDADKNNRAVRKTGGNAGNKVGSYQGDAIRNIYGWFGTYTWGNGSAYGVFTSNVYAPNALLGGNTSQYNYNTVVFDASTAVPTAHDNRPKNVSVNYIVKY